MKQILLLIPLLLISCGIKLPRGNNRLPAPLPNISAPDLEPINGPVDYFGYPYPPSKESITKIIKAGDVNAMEALVLRYDMLSRDDYRYEFHVRDILEMLSESEDALSFLNDWRFENRESGYVALAFARYYIDEAWNARGTGYINTVSKESRDLMDENLALARESLDSVYAKDSQIVYLWNSHLRIATVYGSKRYALQAVNGALAINPHLSLIREQFANHLRPRWGGSYRLMEAFADRCDSLAQYNPRLLTIRAVMVDDQARVLLLDQNDSAAAMEKYAEELAINPSDKSQNWWVCKYYWDKHNYGKAVTFSRNLVTLFPEETAQKFYESHAKLLYMYAKNNRNSMSEAENNKLIEEMVKYNEKALHYDPGNEWARKNQRWYNQFIRNGRVVM